MALFVFKYILLIEKIYKQLNNNSIGYVIVGEENIIINGNIKVYNLYLEFTNIKYNKYEKKRIINKYLDKLIDREVNISDNIICYLDELDKNYNINNN